MNFGLVIPCYNEAERLHVAEIDELLNGNPNLHVLLVNDGSSDGTQALIEDLASKRPRLTAFSLRQNSGKAEAVRQGLLKLSADKGLGCLGYADADFATPAYELLRLMRIFEEKKPVALLGSRVLLLGYDIQRRARRHYIGRVFATFASLALKVPVYDTQCGAKFFTVDPDFEKAISSRFSSRWAFDVEFLGRLIAAGAMRKPGKIIEVPLFKWTDVAGSKLKLSAMIKAGLDVLMIWFRMRLT